MVPALGNTERDLGQTLDMMVISPGRERDESQLLRAGAERVSQ